MTTNTRISFVRHGEVENPREILYGRLPWFRLSERGLAQTTATAQGLTPEALYSSPRLRARQTAAAMASKGIEKQIRILRLLDETRTGAEGLPRSLVEARD